MVVHITTWKKNGNYTWVRKRILSATCSPTLVYRRCSTWHPFATLANRMCSAWRTCIAMHPSALWQRLWPYSILFLDVYLVCLAGELTTKRRQPLWTSVHISGSMHFRTHVYYIFFLFWWVLPSLKTFHTFLTLRVIYNGFSCNVKLSLKWTFNFGEEIVVAQTHIGCFNNSHRQWSRKSVPTLSRDTWCYHEGIWDCSQ